MPLVFLLSIVVSVSSANASCPLPSRSRGAVYQFRQSHPCPVTGLIYGACPGWEVDHVIPLACCGKDAPENMRWLETELHRLRHKDGLHCERYKSDPSVYGTP